MKIMSKKNWEKFEVQCYKKLNSLLNHDESIRIQRNGGSDSTKSDIDIFKNKKLKTSIECKYSPAQSGQFVIMYRNKKFELSSKNKYINNISKDILDIINQENITDNDIKQNAIKINLPNHILKNWIINHYKEKKSELIMTSTKLNSYIAIIPFLKIDQYFKMTAVIRKKKSGSRDISKKNIEITKNKIKSHFQNINVKVEYFEIENKKLFVKINTYPELYDKYYLDNNNLYLSYDALKNMHRIKQLSKTNNSTVIFLLEYIGPKNNIGTQELLNIFNT